MHQIGATLLLVKHLPPLIEANCHAKDGLFPHFWRVVKAEIGGRVKDNGAMHACSLLTRDKILCIAEQNVNDSQM